MICARCLVQFQAAAAHAAHLIEIHGVPAMLALREARMPAEAPLPTPAPADPPPADPTTTEEPPMPGSTKGQTGATWRCGTCGKVGHTARSCPNPKAATTEKRCGYCRRLKTDHTATCQRAQGATKTATAAKATSPPPPTNGADPIATIRQALDQLETELIRVRALKVELAKVLGG